MRIVSAHIFSKSFGGKIKKFFQIVVETTMTSEQRIFFRQTIRT